MKTRDYAVNRGDIVFEIFADDYKMYVSSAPVRRSYALTKRVTSVLEPYEGVKFSAFGQFNQDYRDYTVRGNHLHMFRMYTTEKMLEQDIAVFRRRFLRRTGFDLGEICERFEQKDRTVF